MIDWADEGQVEEFSQKLSVNDKKKEIMKVKYERYG